MEALFIGQAYIDVTFLADAIPTGDEKSVARDYAISFGGNAVTAAFAAPSSASRPTCSTSVADDWLGRMFIDMAAKYGISVHHRKVQRSSLSFIMPRGGQRAIVRCRDDDYLHPFPPLNLERLPGAPSRRPPARRRHPLRQICREAGRPDLARRRRPALQHARAPGLHRRGGRGRAPVRADGPTTGEMLDYLEARGCRDRRRHAGRARHALVRRAGAAAHCRPSPCPPDRVVDTNGAGDIFHGAYIYSAIARPRRAGSEHFPFARAASAQRSSISATRRACLPGGHRGRPARIDRAGRRGRGVEPRLLAYHPRRRESLPAAFRGARPGDSGSGPAQTSAP